MKAGRFITVEGIEGVGKTTNLEFIENYLMQHGVDVVVRTREPGGTPLAEDIRALLLQERAEEVDAVTELLLMFAARAQHVSSVIRPALARGEWVLCDRFTDSSYAYQGGGRGIPEEQIQVLETLVLDDFEPDLTIILDLTVERALQRAEERSAKDRFEQEERLFFERVRQDYLRRAERYPHRCHVVATTAALEKVQQSLAKILDEHVLSD
ncbi:MAG: dTMP kinase [Pseudomonadales bacterium]|jgi:dTMP kinase|nr:dTMP kinase [Pseudomonadales bacterium]MDP7358483.1 dTMP kinase [Pseudomonadales bacterium]MDP7594926.1 dTMP kinase [Pseudomonadales bacterium]HJN50010.1 dTMP kinase [Pseudomonadales bacterium]|tara:strand:+ start:879 stop:1511 length:633 start_codon:yes stop_codon:yes gene_type:complete